MLSTRPVVGLLALTGIVYLLAVWNAGAFAQNLDVATLWNPTQPECDGMLVDEECKSEAEVVKLLQAALNEAGCDVGAVDGVIGPRTRGWLKVHDTIWDDVSYQTLFDEKRGDDLVVRVELLTGMVCARAYQMSRECQTAYTKWKQAPGAGAFAVSGLGGCASASGYASVSAAKSAVLARCSKNGTSCRIQDTKGEAGGTRSSVSCDTSDRGYRSLEAPKALIESSSGCFAYSGGTHIALRTRALRYCKSKGGKNCRVIDTR